MTEQAKQQELCPVCGQEKTPHPNGKGTVCQACWKTRHQGGIDDYDADGHLSDAERIERAKQKVREMGLGR